MVAPHRMRSAASALGALAAVLWGVSLVRPPAPTGPGLDQSWRIGITLAAEHGLRFGQDVVFTFGPLGFALQGIADPALAAATALVNALLAAVAAVGVWSALSGRGSPVVRVLGAAAIVVFATNITLDYVAVVGVVGLLIRAARYPRAAPLVGLGVGAVALVGLLSKYTLGIDALAAGTAVWLVAAIRGPRRRRRAALTGAAAGYGVALLGLAAAFGFSPAALGAYVRGAVAISNGYSAGMALPGPSAPVAAALAVAGAVLVLATAAARAGKPEQALLAAVVTFLAWKHGFVRQDGHVVYYFGTMAAVAPLLATVLRRGVGLALGTATTALALAAYVWAQGSVFGPPVLFDPARIAHGAAYLAHPRVSEARIAERTDTALWSDRLPADAAARIGAATFDVMPWETAIVRANGLRWDPLPVFQAYSAYTPSLDRLNRDALAAHGAEFVLFRYISIDDRYPFGDQPATAAELLCRYAVVMPHLTTQHGDPYVLLRRGGRAHCDGEPLGAADAPAMGAPIAVPSAGSRDAFVVASFAVRPTLVARARNALWRAPVIFLDVRYADGSLRRWRTVAATLADGVIVSPAPRDDAEAEAFLAGRPAPAVRSVALDAPPGSFVIDGVTFMRLRRR
ncbi:MAG TPA: hypothetical protein VE826_07830 [Dongiaceae bacterium]|nr:hypothetical protein [Dongiaceae bacterium]